MFTEIMDGLSIVQRHVIVAFVASDPHFMLFGVMAGHARQGFSGFSRGVPNDVLHSLSTSSVTKDIAAAGPIIVHSGRSYGCKMRRIGSIGIEMFFAQHILIKGGAFKTISVARIGISLEM
jgi:hypothetical protein